MLKISEVNGVLDYSNVTWKFKGDEQEYNVSWDVCKSPFCSCATLTISLSANNTCVTSFKYDIETDEVKRVNDVTPGMDTAKLFVAELTDGDRRVIIHLFKSEKARIVKECDLTQFDVPEFPVEKIEYESSMVGYDEIFPFNDEISFTLDTITYLVADQYCLNTHCKCTSVIINIIPPQIGSLRTLFTNATAVSYNYVNGKWEVIERGCDHPDPAVLVKALKEQCPQVNKIFSERKLQLKELYKKYKVKFQSDLQLRTVHQLYSRNDPCPCGSGKKFKKCCGK